MKAAASIAHRSESGPHLLRSHICSHSLCARLMRQIPSIPPSGEHSHVQAALQVLLRPLPPVPPPTPFPVLPLLTCSGSPPGPSAETGRFRL